MKKTETRVFFFLDVDGVISTIKTQKQMHDYGFEPS